MSFGYSVSVLIDFVQEAGAIDCLFTFRISVFVNSSEPKSDDEFVYICCVTVDS